jgi:hypothetical protein
VVAVRRNAPQPGKPVAGEWETDHYCAVDGWPIRMSGDSGSPVANVYREVSIDEAKDGRWSFNLYDNNCEVIIQHGDGFDSTEDAMRAADAYAREHAAELDWQIPPEVQPVAPRGLTEAEIEACARAGFVAHKRPLEDALPYATWEAAREVIEGRGQHYTAEFREAVLAKAATLRAHPAATHPGKEQP